MEVGSYVYDRDSDEEKPAVVIEKPGVSADEWDVNDEETVSQRNPDHPEDDNVIIVVFVEDLDEWWSDWRETSPEEYFDEIKERGHKFYAFPESRLAELNGDRQKLDHIYRALKKEGYRDIELKTDEVVIHKFGECSVNVDGEVKGDSSIKNSIEKVIESHSF